MDAMVSNGRTAWGEVGGSLDGITDASGRSRREARAQTARKGINFLIVIPAKRSASRDR